LPLAIFYPLSSILAFGGRAAARPYRVFHLVSACFTWFQLSGGKIGAGGLKIGFFGDEEHFTYTSGLRGISTRFRFTLFHLVALTPR